MKKIISIFLIGIVIIIVIGCYFIMTPHGSALLGRILFKALVPAYQPDPEFAQGSLFKGLQFENLEIPLDSNDQFPDGTMLRIEWLEILVGGIRPQDMDIELRNARIVIPRGDPVICSGTYHQGRLDVNLFARTISMQQIMPFIPNVPVDWRQSQGTLSDTDLFIKGPLNQIQISGRWTIDKFKKDDFVIQNNVVDIQLEIRGADNNDGLNGFIEFQGGTARGARTALVHLDKGRLTFDRFAADNPDLNLRAWAQVEKTKINIRLEGPVKNPAIVLTSQPPAPQAQLMIMLATNRSWQGTEALFDQKIPGNLVKDFIDYFLFSGSGSEMAKKFGIKDFYVNYDDQVQGFGVTKSVTESVDAIYEVEQRPTDTQGKLNREHKIGGSVQILDNLSVTAKQGFKENSPTSQQERSDPEARGESEVKVKFEQRF